MAKGTIIALEKKPRNKCRKWQLRVSAGLNPATGKYRTRTHRVTGTYSDAQKELRNFVEEVELEEHIGRENITFDVGIDLYLEARSYELRASSIVTYTNELKTVSRHLGKMTVRKVTRAMIEDIRTALFRGETRSGKPMSTGTVSSTMKTLHAFFDWCVQRGYADKNPVDLVPIKVTRKPKKVLSSQEMNDFVAKLDPQESHELALLFYTTMGLRRSEALSLVWDDIDLRERSITIRESKTDAGLRKLPMPDIIFDGIRKRKTKQKQYLKEQAGQTPVLDDGAGHDLTPTAMSSWWQYHAKDYGMGDYTLHELRHSYLTALAVSGVHPRIAMELAGHKNPSTTMAIYQHVDMSMKRDAVNLFENSNPLAEKD